MFYEQNPEPHLRCGDILMGINIIHPKAELPYSNSMDISIATGYVAIITPCCSIGRKSLFCVTPLLPLEDVWIRNEHLTNNYTLINKPMVPRNSISQKHYESLIEEKKQQYLDDTPKYTFVDYFVFQSHELLKSYKLGKTNPQEYNFYCINFSKIYTIEANNYTYSNGTVPEIPKGLKLLQLTQEARQDLRNKLTFYFGRDADNPTS